MSHVLGRVTAPRNGPRGPDVTHRIRVRKAWLAEGETLEIELPRTLSCARCDGGGCDTCGGAGAFALRRHDELPELIQVTLPKGPVDGRGVPRERIALRIPEAGALSEAGNVPRGDLLLTVIGADVADGAVRVRGPTRRPPPSAPAVSRRPGPMARRRVVLAEGLLIAWMVALILLRWCGVA